MERKALFVINYIPTGRLLLLLCWPSSTLKVLPQHIIRLRGEEEGEKLSSVVVNRVTYACNEAIIIKLIHFIWAGHHRWWSCDRLRKFRYRHHIAIVNYHKIYFYGERTSMINKAIMKRKIFYLIFMTPFGPLFSTIHRRWMCMYKI